MVLRLKAGLQSQLTCPFRFYQFCVGPGRKRAPNFCNFTAVGVLALVGLPCVDTQLPETKRKSWRGWADSNQRPALRWAFCHRWPGWPRTNLAKRSLFQSLYVGMKRPRKTVHGINHGVLDVSPFSFAVFESAPEYSCLDTSEADMVIPFPFK